MYLEFVQQKRQASPVVYRSAQVVFVSPQVPRVGRVQQVVLFFWWIVARLSRWSSTVYGCKAETH